MFSHSTLKQQMAADATQTFQNCFGKLAGLGIVASGLKSYTLFKSESPCIAEAPLKGQKWSFAAPVWS